MREAGFKVKRTVLPGSTFWNDWTKYPFSTTNWNMRPLGVQILALAYRSGEAWNETAFANPEFDAKLDAALAIADADKRKELMEEIEKILQDSGIIIQPTGARSSVTRARREGPRHAPDLRAPLGKVWLDKEA